MSSKIRVIVSLILSLILAGCSGGGGGGGSDPVGSQGAAVASGVISLSGADVGAVGSTLLVGSVLSVPQEGSFPDYAILAPAGTAFDAETKMPIPSDPNNGFAVIVNQNFPAGGFDSAISMTIRVNAVDYGYICHFPQASAADCGGGISLDLDSGSVTLVDVEVEHTDSGNILVLNGSVSW
tara:strand:+ start:188270 stop:188812 length:543 start_codon:yes stop_codon:yes gene_type:complete